MDGGPRELSRFDGSGGGRKIRRMGDSEDPAGAAHQRVRVYVACSLDGFIAGPDDDLSWLHDTSGRPDAPAPPSEALEFASFMQETGAILMGRRTYEVVKELTTDAAWPYGDTVVLVATTRPLGATPATAKVRGKAGDIAGIIAAAKELAGDLHVYLDGGDVIRQALNEGLVDELIITFVPILLGGGTRLFDGLVSRTSLEFTEHHRLGHDKLQVRARVRGS